MPDRPRVCIIDSARLGAALGSLERSGVDVVSVLPRFVELQADAISTFDLILIACDERTLLNERFELAVRRMSAVRPLLAIVKRPTDRIAIQAARTGFSGLVPSDVRRRALERTIAAALRGELAFPRSALSALVRLAMSARRSPVPLTSRQRQVVTLIASGATDEQIGRTLGISSSTAHKHVLGAFRRMNVRTRGQLVAAVGLLAAPW